MLGRVYTFECDEQTNALHGLELVSASAINAIIAAINDEPGVRFEELTESDNPRPIVVVLFAGRKQMQYFDELIGPALRLSGVRARVMQDTESIESDLIDQPCRELPLDIDLSRLHGIVPTRAA